MVLDILWKWEKESEPVKVQKENVDLRADVTFEHVSHELEMWT